MVNWLKVSVLPLTLMISASSATASETTAYTYDALGRLIAVSSNGTVNNGQNISTTFDPAGNRTNYSVTGTSSPSPTFYASGASATEGGALNFVITRSGSTTASASVNYTTVNGSAISPGDYTAKSGILTFAPGQSSATISVTTIDDNIVENTEVMTLELSSPSSGMTIGSAPVSGTIVENDAGLTIGSANTTEGGTLVFSVTRSGSVAGISSANYAAASGTAILGSDFTATSGTITFTANQTSATISVTTIDDAVVEAPEAMSVSLSNPSSGTIIATSAGTGTINDNDVAAPTIPGSYAMVGGTVTPAMSGYSDGTVTPGVRGSLTPSSIGSGYVISSVLGAGANSGQVSFSIASPAGQTALANSGWTSITIPGVGTLTRSSATYSTVVDSSGRQTAKWTWPNSFLTANSGTVVIQ